MTRVKTRQAHTNWTERTAVIRLFHGCSGPGNVSPSCTPSVDVGVGVYHFTSSLLTTITLHTTHYTLHTSPHNKTPHIHTHIHYITLYNIITVFFHSLPLSFFSTLCLTCHFPLWHTHMGMRTTTVVFSTGRLATENKPRIFIASLYVF